jgi:hypothetical protein
MAKASTEIVIQRSADDVWARIRRFDDITWRDGVATCKVEDGIRTVTMAARPDIAIQQRELARDESNRTYSYGLHAYGGDTLFKHANGQVFDLKSMIGRHKATVAVTPQTASTCIVRYTVEIEDGYDLMLEGTKSGYTAALSQLKQKLEV